MSSTASLCPPAPTSCRLRVDVSGGLDGIARIVCLLRSRRYEIVRFCADVGAGPGALTRVTWDLAPGPADLDLLRRRLERLPTVLAVDVDLSPDDIDAPRLQPQT